MKTFEEYMAKKKIKVQRFQAERSEEWLELKKLYELIGEASFDQQKKYFINDWRLRFR